MGQRLAQITLAPADAAVNGYALVQAAGGAGNLVLAAGLMVAGVGTPDIPRRVAITSTGDETGKVFTITGTDRYDRAMVESLAGPGAAASVNSRNDFKTVTQVAINAASAGNVRVGTSQTVSSGWYPVDRVSSFNLGIQVDPDVGVTYTVEQTNDDPFTPGVGVQPAGGVPSFSLTPVPIAALAAKNTQQYAAVTSGVAAVRLVLTAFGTGGKAVMKLAPAAMELQ